MDFLTDTVDNKPSSKVNTEMNTLRKPCTLSTLVVIAIINFL